MSQSRSLNDIVKLAPSYLLPLRAFLDLDVKDLDHYAKVSLLVTVEGVGEDKFELVEERRRRRVVGARRVPVVAHP